jgi:hypothetical protein
MEKAPFALALLDFPVHLPSGIFWAFWPLLLFCPGAQAGIATVYPKQVNFS